VEHEFFALISIPFAAFFMRGPNQSLDWLWALSFLPALPAMQLLGLGWSRLPLDSVSVPFRKRSMNKALSDEYLCGLSFAHSPPDYPHTEIGLLDPPSPSSALKH